MNGNGRQYDIIDALSFLSFLLGYENLMENREQSRQNDISAANDKQAKFILERLERRFDEQDKLIKELADAIKRIERGM